MLYKKGLLFSHISPYFNIYLSYVFFHSEMEKFKKTFSLNGYPTSYPGPLRGTEALVREAKALVNTGHVTPKILDIS
jgi:hypothetical protein